MNIESDGKMHIYYSLSFTNLNSMKQIFQTIEYIRVNQMSIINYNVLKRLNNFIVVYIN